MPLNVRRFYTSVLLVLFSFILITNAQTIQPAQNPNPQAIVPQTTAPVNPPTSGDIMRERISKAKAFIAVRNYNAAIYELEGIRRESNDAAVQAVTNVLLMNSYLEQGDYKRAQDFLNQSFNAQKTTKPGASAMYFAIAGQVVKGARNRIERYRALGLNVSDRTLPLEAVNDLEKMRETLELVVTQTKEIGKDKAKTADAMALLEEASNSRSMMARDDYDSRRWKDEVADTREQLTSSRSIVLNAVNSDTPSDTGTSNTVAANQPTANPNIPVSAQIAPAFKPVPADTNSSSAKTQETPTFKSINPDPAAKKPADTLVASNTKPEIGAPASASEAPKKEPETKADNGAEPKRIRIVGNQPGAEDAPKKEESPAAKETVTSDSPLSVGSLIAYATRQTQPVYPAAARSMRATGVVKVEVTVNENGEVAEVQKASGPPMLQSAAKDAIMKWRFRPFVRDGQPVKATGYVSFNFSL